VGQKETLSASAAATLVQQQRDQRTLNARVGAQEQAKEIRRLTRVQNRNLSDTGTNRVPLTDPILYQTKPAPPVI
jgi:hypothetical protein